MSHPTNGRNPSNNLSCSHCHTQIPSWAVFCSFCGERVEKNGEWENGDDDTQTQLAIPLQRKLLQSLPVTPTPSISDAWQKIPETVISTLLSSEELNTPSNPVPGIDTKRHSAVTQLPQRKVTSNPSGSDWLWPTIIIISAVAAGLVNFVFTDTAIRPVIEFWFLFVCPGMVLVRFLRLKEPIVEWVLAFALSFAIDAIVAGAQLYAGRWSPTVTLSILIGLSLCGAIVQLVSSALSVPKLQYTVRLRKPGVLLPILLTLLVGIIVGASLWSYAVYHGSGFATSTAALPHSATPHSSPTSRVIPTPSSTSSAKIVGLYYGTIYDIPANATTEMSLTGFQQTQRSISGNFIGLHMTGTFKGIIEPSKHFQFMVKDSAGRLILFFDGDIQPSATLSGNYCSINQEAQCTGEYGIWSVAPSS